MHLTNTQGAYHRKPSGNGSKLQAVSMTSVSTFLKEQLELISRAIEVESGKARPDPKHCEAVASEIQSKRRGTSPSRSDFGGLLAHPATAALVDLVKKTIWSEPKHIWVLKLGGTFGLQGLFEQIKQHK